MPEGHTIHRLARALRRDLAEGPLHATSPQGRFAAGAALIDGSTLRSAEAWGKYLFVSTDTGQILHVHLGLIGKFRPVGHPPPPARDTVRLRLGNQGGWWDLVGPARCELVSPDERAAIVAGLGPDPLRPRPDVDRFHDRLRRTSRPIGAVLLDQRVIAGLGNIYRAEVLYLAGLHPSTPANRLAADQRDALWTESVRLLRIGFRTGRILTTDPAEIGRPRSRMRAADAHYVYHREFCRRCGTALGTLHLGGRPIQFCPDCQPALNHRSG